MYIHGRESLGFVKRHRAKIRALAELAEQAGRLDLGPLRRVGAPAHYLAALHLNRVAKGAEGVHERQASRPHDKESRS